MKKKLFASELDSWYNWYLTKDGIAHYAHYAINPLLYLRTLKREIC